MKKASYIFITIICLLIANKNVRSYSLEEELKPYKEEANEIVISFQYNENYVDSSGNKKNGMFNLKISNLTENLKIKIDNEDTFYYYKNTNNGELLFEGVESGIKKIHVYSVRHPSFLKTITINIPKYNYYSEREECKEIGEENLDVCNKWYKYELNETTFLKKIKDYQKEQEEIKKEIKEISLIKQFFDNIVEFLKSYIVYIVVSIIIIAGTVIYIKIRKKKYSLE